MRDRYDVHNVLCNLKLQRHYPQAGIGGRDPDCPRRKKSIITSAHQAEEILREGKADLILVGRELLKNPYFTLQAAKELGDVIQWPGQYLRAK